MEFTKEKKYLIDNEQNINIDDTFLKFSLRDIISFQQAINNIMQDMSKFNDERDKKLEGAALISNINKDLDFNRRVKTYISKLEDNKSKNSELDLVLEDQRERRISEITHYFSNTLKYNILSKDRKATEDEDMIRKTGYFANPDDDSYQSNPGVIQKANFGSGNLAMRTEE